MALENAIIEAKAEDEWVYLEGDKRVFFSEKEGLGPEGAKALKYIWKGPGCNIVKKKNINGLRVGFSGAQNAGRLKK